VDAEEIQLRTAESMRSLAALKVDASGSPLGGRPELFDAVIPPGGVGAELGVYKGRLSRWIMKFNRPQVLHLVDPWFGRFDSWTWAEGDASPSRALGTILMAMAHHVDSGRVRIHIQDDLDFLGSPAADGLDWVYVDTTHQFEHTRHELLLASKKVRHGGIIAGGDLVDDPSHPHFGVNQAVEEFLAGDKTWEMVYREGPDWALQKSLEAEPEPIE